MDVACTRISLCRKRNVESGRMIDKRIKRWGILLIVVGNLAKSRIIISLMLSIVEIELFRSPFSFECFGLTTKLTSVKGCVLRKLCVGS